MKKCISLFLALSISLSSMLVASEITDQEAVEELSDVDYSELASTAFFFVVLPGITMFLGGQGSELILRGPPTNALT